jgi:cytochrome c oxidase subunit 1
LTGCAPLSTRLVKTQIWLWFVGMMVLTMPWHLVGLLGAPRRMAYYDFTHPDLQSQAWTVTASAIGGFVLLASGVLFIYVLATARKRENVKVEPFTFSRTAHPGGHTPVALNGFGLWVAMMIGLTVVNYGYPIFQIASLKEASVPVIPIGSR